LNKAQISRADAPQPNVAVYEIDPLHNSVQQVSLHAPGTVTPAFVVPQGQYVTPNGHFAMAESSLGNYQVWNLQTGMQAAGWAASAGKSIPTSMAVSPNGTFAAISSVSTVNPASWTVALFNLPANTRYVFNGTNSTTPLPSGSATLQLQPTIVGWTGDESALILSTGVPFSDAPTHLFFKMAMSGLTFTASGTAGSAVPPVTTLGADQQITQLIFSPDSTRAAFLVEDSSNTPVGFVPLSGGPGVGLPPNSIKVIGLASNAATSVAQAAAGQGLTAPAWSSDGSKLYFGAGPFQSTPYPVSIHLFNYDFSSLAITAGNALIASDPAHIGVSDMQVCADQVFLREVSVIPAPSTSTSASLAGKITSAPLSNLTTHTDVYTTVDNALGACVPAVTGTGSTGGSGGVVPSVPTSAGSIPTIIPSATLPSAPIACILAPHLVIGGMGIVSPGPANNLRSTPTVGSSLIGQIPSGQTFSVLAGPFCDTTSGYQYWQVKYNGITGYSAEGKTTYLLLPYVALTPLPTISVSATPSTVPPTLIPGTCITGYVWREANPVDHVCVTPDVRAQAAADNAAASGRVVPVGTCINGYVWREASATDHVCVIPAVRSQAAADNAAASSRVDPSGPYGPHPCVNGYVWREAFANDVVCVIGAVRSQAAADNAAANSRVVPVGTCVNGYVWREAFPGDLVCVIPAVRAQAAADNAAASSRIAH